MKLFLEVYFFLRCWLVCGWGEYFFFFGGRTFSSKEKEKGSTHRYLFERYFRPSKRKTKIGAEPFFIYLSILSSKNGKKPNNRFLSYTHRHPHINKHRNFKKDTPAQNKMQRRNEILSMQRKFSTSVCFS